MILRRFAIAACLALLGGAAWAQTTAPATSASRPAALKDLCKEGVDPYNPITERSLFLSAAGVDNELSEAEFAAAVAKPRSFARPFDRWALLLAYDKNRNKTIDWYEADAYRRALRKQVLGAFDVNKDAKLAGDERDRANKALAEGRFPISAGGASGRGPGGDRWRRRMMSKYDKDGDGVLSEEERRAAMRDLREQERKQNLARYDADGDGQLSESERQAMRRERNGAWGETMERMRIDHFDADNDGKLDEAEQAQLREFMKSVGEMTGRWRDSFMDTNGDGRVSAEERTAMGEQMRTIQWHMMVKTWRAMDADGDGQVSMDERTAFEKNVRKNVQEWFAKTVKQADANGDGRLLTAAERKNLLTGMDEEFKSRVKKSDANGDGRLDAAEMEDMMTTFAEDIGALPKAKK